MMENADRSGEMRFLVHVRSEIGVCGLVCGNALGTTTCASRVNKCLGLGFFLLFLDEVGLGVCVSTDRISAKLASMAKWITIPKLQFAR